MNPAIPGGRPPGHGSQHPENHQNGQDKFRRFSQVIANAVGSPWAFTIAVAAIVVWAVSGPLFGFSDTWQLVINTATTIVTFLMVFLIQNTQNRDARAIHLKLDELIRAKKGARNNLVDLEDCTEEELQKLESEFKAVRARRVQEQEDSPQPSKPESKREPARAGK